MKLKFKLKKISFSNLIYLVSLSIYTTLKLVSSTFFGAIPLTRTIILFLTALILIADTAITRITMKSFLAVFICILITIVGIINGNDVFVICTPSFIYCARNKDFEKIAKTGLYSSIICLVFVILCSNFNIILDYVFYMNGRVRHTLGFRYVLMPPAIYKNIVLLKLYLDKENIKWRSIIIMTIINFYFFYLTDSRLSFFLTCLALLLGVFFKVFPNCLERLNVTRRCMVLSPIICSFVSLFITANYKINPYLITLNSLLGYRLSMGKAALESYGISLFGSKLDMVGNGLSVDGVMNTRIHNYIDCSYVQFLLNYGVVSYFLVIVVFSYAIFNSSKKKDYYMLLVLTIIAGHMMIDDYAIHLGFNTFILALGTLCFKNNTFLRKTE